MGDRTNSTLMRVDLETYNKVRALADAEKRPMNAQLSILVDKGLEALGIEVSSLPETPTHETAAS